MAQSESGSKRPRALAGSWRGDLAGGFNAALVALPIELVYGLFAVAPLGLDWAQHGLRAALWACVMGGLLYTLLRTAGGMISGTASVTALLLGTLAASLMQHPGIQASNDPAATAFGLLLLCTAMAGAAQWLFGVAGLGRVLKFVPYPVVAGLMFGVAILLLLASLRPALGLPMGTTWLFTLAHWRPLATLVFAVALGLCFWLYRRYPRLPGPALAMLAGALLHHMLAMVDADGVGGTSNAIDALLPDHSVWAMVFDQGAAPLLAWLPLLAPYALAIAALASLESLLCLPLIEEVGNQRFQGDGQLRRQGLVNMVGGIVGATMTVSTPSRVAINLASGARSTLSALVYALTLALAVVFLGRWLDHVPDAVTAAILVYMASRMIDDGTRRLAHQVVTQRRAIDPAQYRMLLANLGVVLLVALVVVLGDMLKGVAVGVVAAMFLFVRAGMRPVVRRVATAQERRSLKVRPMADMQVLETDGRRITVIDVEGALFFGTADQLAREIDALPNDTVWLILDLRRVSDVDSTGARSLLLTAKRLHTRGRSLSLAGANPRVERVLQTMGLHPAIAPVLWFDDLDRALEVHEDLLLRQSGSGAGQAHLSLLQTALAQGLSEAQCVLLQSYLQLRQCAAGEPVFRSGEAGNSLFVSTDCVVDIMLPQGNGRSKRIASFAPGVVFGEMALLDNMPRSADAVAKSAGTAWELTRETLSEIERQHPEIASRILLNLSRSLAERLRLTTMQLGVATEQ